ncbi:MAG: nickel pincer cofactor biosynthesis protein LarC [Lachnospiraceae bacterium]|nr:nickel pincer cofactor biosynthesis protein LarC [Lachnospiraceae bacterium]
MNKSLYLECYSGISGDMTVAMLLDLGASEQVLKDALKSIPLEGYEIIISKVYKSSIEAVDFLVKLDAEHENHDHDMEYLHGKGHTKDEHHHFAHEHRGLAEIKEIIRQTNMTDRARKFATDMFEVLAEAEAKAHNVEVEQVHFHEVGALDSIVDIIALAVCFDNLNIDEVIVPYVCEGRGQVRTQHGKLSIPVPAVTNIMSKYRIPIRLTDVEGELITPTGAAFLAVAATTGRLPEQFRIQKTGTGAGKRNYDCPGVLRGMLIESAASEQKDTVVLMETNIDDCSGELLGALMEELFEAGARDVHFVPCSMKKNRPGFLVRVITTEDRRETLEQIIFRNTTTIGVRYTQMSRTILPREEVYISTEYGKITGKKCLLPDGEVRIYPEFDEVHKVAQQKNVSCQKVIESFNQALIGRR